MISSQDSLASTSSHLPTALTLPTNQGPVRQLYTHDFGKAQLAFLSPNSQVKPRLCLSAGLVLVVIRQMLKNQPLRQWVRKTLEHFHSAFWVSLFERKLPFRSLSFWFSVIMDKK